jgi:hypothetical protein
MTGLLWLGLLTAAALAIVRGTLRAGISPMPSSRRACEAMLQAAADAPEGPVVDLGAGWGGLAIHFARAHPHREVIGYELSWVPWAFASLRARCLGLANLRFHRQDFRGRDWGEAGVLLCYLFREGMAQLARDLEHSGRRPRLLISNSFALPGHRAWRVVTLRDWQRTRIHVYRFDGPSSG